MKKVFTGLLVIAAILVVLPMFAAFEAHVINVTAKIENALSVSTTAIDFGTVFPQEHLNKPLLVALSGSFMDEDRVDDVEYFIRQKPKCAWTWNNGTEFDPSHTATGHVIPDGSETGYRIDCGEAPGVDGLPTDATWGVLPSLCEYVSKEDDQTPDNDGSLASFHQPWTVSNGVVNWNDTAGYLAKSANDTEDNWTIDLAVPCFGGYCAQDWEEFVHGINPQADPAEYTQPKENEHKIFGCDLWVEVGGISLPGGGVGCADKADVMLVLDRSGSIGSDLQTLKDAALGFVSALAPSTNGVHMGQSSFSSNGNLDAHLTDDVATINTAINSLISNGSTNLASGINLATSELGNPGDNHDRVDGESPDYMVIITDGQPNTPDGEVAARAAGIAAANAAKAAGIEIFVVGVGDGVNASTTAYLRDNIASGTDHYYAAADFDDLEAVLDAIAECDNGNGNPPPGPDTNPSTREEIFGDDMSDEGIFSSNWVKSCPSGSSGCASSDVFLGTTTPQNAGNQYVEIRDDAAITTTIDTAGYHDIKLSYARSTAGFEPIELDQLRAEWRVGSAPSDPWMLINAESAANSPWESHTYSLPTDADNQTVIQIRFYTMSNGDTDHGLIDDVLVTGLTP